MLELTNKETGEITILDGEEEVAYKHQRLQTWYHAKFAADAAKFVIETEQIYRKEIAELFFPDATEGTNNLELSEGWKLKLTYKIDRKVDGAVLLDVQKQLREMGVNPDLLIDMKPSLNIKAYKGLQQINEDAVKVFEQALIIKPASPTLELVQPKSSENSTQGE